MRNVSKLLETKKYKKVKDVKVNDEVFCEAPVTETAPQWSETRKLILEKYVTFREIIEFAATRKAAVGALEGFHGVILLHPR